MIDLPASEKKIRLVLRSRRIATGVVSYNIPLVGPFGKMYLTTKAMTVYERVLDEDQKNMLEEATRFSATSGIKLEVIDLGKKNFLSRAIWDLTRKFENPPSIVFRGNIALQFLLAEAELRVENCLEPEAGVNDVYAMLSQLKGVQSAMLVSHFPLLGLVIRDLLDWHVQRKNLISRSRSDNKS